MRLEEFFSAHPRAALAYSGGTDSAYLLYAALKCGAEVRPYYVRSAFQPEFEYADALRLAHELGARLRVIELDILNNPEVRANSPLRCYHCKRKIMGSISSAASEDGFSLLIDGTNASDDAGDRPGMRALRELEVLSPLRLCGLTKPEIRRLSRQAGLFTWDKPAYACLATRIPTGEEISLRKLQKAERGENALFALGFRDFRLRLRGDSALLQLTRADREKASTMLPELRAALGEDFKEINIDENERQSSL